MFKDTFISVRDNIVRKVTNPFLSTFTGVWIIRNWEFVYSIFFFPESYSLEKRLENIASHFANYTFWDLLITVLITFGVLIGTYLLLSASRLVVNFFDKIVTPKLYQWTDKGSVVLKQDYQVLEAEIGRLESKYREEKENRLRLNDEVEKLEKRIVELLSSKDPLDDLEEIKDVRELTLHDKVEKALLQVKDKFDLSAVEDKLADVKTGLILDKEEPILRELIKLGAVVFDNDTGISRSSGYFAITEFGEVFLERVILERSK